MSKYGSTGTLTIFSLDYNSTLPIYKQISRELKVAIISGRLAGGARLPATRTLASELGVSRNTIMSVSRIWQLKDTYKPGWKWDVRFGRLPEEHLLPGEAVRSAWREPVVGSSSCRLAAGKWLSSQGNRFPTKLYCRVRFVRSSRS